MAVENRKEQRRGGLRLFALVAGLYVFALLLSGCSCQQPGETSAEVNRKHLRVLRLNTQMMMSDLDKFWLLDKPSMLTDKRIP